MWRALPVGMLLLLAPAAWLGVALLMLLWPTGSGPRDGGSVPLKLLSNGVHVDLVVPLRGWGVDWSETFSPRVFPAPPPEDAWLAIGWGDADFYLTTPRWRDLRASTALSALSGSNPTLLHVTWLTDGSRHTSLHDLPITHTQYQRLAPFVRATLEPGSHRGARALPGQHYGGRDAFFAARGHYGPVTTCNTWIGDVLRYAGVDVSPWTPLAINLTAPLPSADRLDRPAGRIAAER